jgi:hypothetical protein
VCQFRLYIAIAGIGKYIVLGQMVIFLEVTLYVIFDNFNMGLSFLSYVNWNH